MLRVRLPSITHRDVKNMDTSKKDEELMLRCVALAEQSVDMGEAPFGSLITKNDEIVVESINGTKRDNDIVSHAEILVIRKAQQKFKTANFCGFTLYSNCEPCPMCSFMIREARFSRVVFALHSSYVGGYTTWQILQDQDLERFSDFFSKPPKVVYGILENEAKKTFDRVGWTQMFS